MSLREEIVASQSIKPQAVTDTLDGVGVDVTGSHSVMVLFNFGTQAAADGTNTFEIQDSADNSTFAAVAAANLTGGGQLAAITQANDDTIVERGYIGAKRYLRVAVTVNSGTGDSMPCAATVIRRTRVQPD